jgi:hypothetical protein
MPLPMVLNETKLNLFMGAGVLNVSVCLKECLDFIQVSCWFHTGANIIKEELQVQFHLIPSDHIVKNHKWP